jgi:hypothetical protein
MTTVTIPTIIAIISIILYALLSMVSLRYFLLIYQRGRFRRNSLLDYNHIPGDAKFTRSKLLFFLSLAISAALDIPLYVGCAVVGGPQDCEWDGYSYSAFWTLHRLALAGYFISLGIPLIQWTDVIYTQDDDIFSKQNSRRFLLISTACYCALQIITSIAVFCASDASKHASYAVSQFNSISNMFEAIFLVFIVAIWLWCGIRLQLYVMRVCFRPEAERRIIFMVNLVLLAVLLSYSLRAFLVFSLSINYCGLYVCHYVVWIIGTRWLPYIVCSFLLIYTMRRSADNSHYDNKNAIYNSDLHSSLINREESTNSSNSTQGGGRSPARVHSGGGGGHNSRINTVNPRSAISGNNRVRARADTAGTNATNGTRASSNTAGTRRTHNSSGESNTETDENDDSRIDVVDDIQVEEYEDEDGEEDEFYSHSSRSGMMSDEYADSYFFGENANTNNTRPHHDSKGYQIQGPGRDSTHSITSIISFLMPSKHSNSNLMNSPASASQNRKVDSANSDEMERNTTWSPIRQQQRQQQQQQQQQPQQHQQQQQQPRHDSNRTDSRQSQASNPSFRANFMSMFSNTSTTTGSNAPSSVGQRTESRNSGAAASAASASLDEGQS